MPDVTLGLIGDNISHSKAPLLHRLAGKQGGLDVRYDMLVPVELGLGFDAVFEDCASQGYRGLNITYPYKETASRKVRMSDPMVAAIGAVNTIVFSDRGPEGFNTDYSGFMAAYRAARGGKSPGRVCMIGTGGVGRAIAFGLLTLGAQELRLVDTAPGKAEVLGRALEEASKETAIVVATDACEAARDADGILNCTPVGMHGHDGTPVPRRGMNSAGWAFDAVYTPVETQFLLDAAAQGLDVISGYELFFHQGVDAWLIFSGLELDQHALRRSLQNPGAHA